MNLKKPSGAETAFPSLATAQTPFSAVKYPVDVIEFTVRGAGITYTMDGTAPVANSVGRDLAPGTYRFEYAADELAAIKMIQNGGTATGSWQAYTDK